MNNREDYPEYLRPVPELPENAVVPPSPEDTRPTYSPRHPAAQSAAIVKAAKKLKTAENNATEEEATREELEAAERLSRLIGPHFGSFISPEDAVQAGLEQYYSVEATYGKDAAKDSREFSMTYGIIYEAAKNLSQNFLARHVSIELPHEKQIEDIDEEMAVRDAYKKLDDKEREVLTEFFMNRLSPEQAAEDLDLNKKEVARLYNQGMQKMSAELQDDDQANISFLPPHHNQQD